MEANTSYSVVDLWPSDCTNKTWPEWRMQTHGRQWRPTAEGLCVCERPWSSVSRGHKLRLNRWGASGLELSGTRVCWGVGGGLSAPSGRRCVREQKSAAAVTTQGRSVAAARQPARFILIKGCCQWQRTVCLVSAWHVSESRKLQGELEEVWWISCSCVCLSLSLGTRRTSIHRPHTRTSTRTQQGKMDAFVASEVMMRDGSWHVSGTWWEEVLIRTTVEAVGCAVFLMWFITHTHIHNSQKEFI